MPSDEEAQAAARIRDAIANGDQPDVEDEELFPDCPACGGKFHGDGCRAGCVYGLVLPPEPATEAAKS